VHNRTGWTTEARAHILALRGGTVTDDELVDLDRLAVAAAARARHEDAITNPAVDVDVLHLAKLAEQLRGAISDVDTGSGASGPSSAG
jgi:hypothetical protein